MHVMIKLLRPEGEPRAWAGAGYTRADALPADTLPPHGGYRFAWRADAGVEVGWRVTVHGRFACRVVKVEEHPSDPGTVLVTAARLP